MIACISALIFAIATLAIALIHTVGALLVLRLVDGISIGGVVSGALSLIAEVTPLRRRARAISIALISVAAVLHSGSGRPRLRRRGDRASRHRRGRDARCHRLRRVVENLRLSLREEGGAAAERGDFSIGGRIPTNVSSGPESRGHPLGATGLAQAHELAIQLRGRAGARQVHGAPVMSEKSPCRILPASDPRRR